MTISKTLTTEDKNNIIYKIYNDPYLEDLDLYDIMKSCLARARTNTSILINLKNMIKDV